MTKQPTENFELILEGNEKALKQIMALFASGELEKILGVPVFGIDTDSQIQTAPPSLTQMSRLTQWFEEIFTTGWQAVEELLAPQLLQATARSQKIQRAKLVNLPVNSLTHSVVLRINLDREQDNSSTVEITLRVYPTGDNVYLPSGLQLLILSDHEVFQEVTTKNADSLIQCQFDGEVGELFSVQLVLDEAVVTEDFVI